MPNGSFKCSSTNLKVWSISVLACKHFPPLGSSGKKKHALPDWEKPLGSNFHPPGYQWILQRMTVDFPGVANMKNCILTIWGIYVPLAHFQVLMASWHNHGSWSCHPRSAISASLFSLGRHWDIWSYQRKASVKVCSWGILSNSTIFRWQILQQRYFSHHTKIFTALWNWKSPREHILWK